LSEELEMLPKFVGNVDEDFDFFITRTRKDRIDFRILQGTKSFILR
jgi:hypothetical protein